MGAKTALLGDSEETLWRRRMELTKNVTLITLILLTMVNLWLSMAPSQPQTPNAASRFHPGVFQNSAPNLSPKQQAETLLLNLQNPNNTWRTFSPEDRHNPLLGYDYGLAHRSDWVKNGTRVWECVNRLGPHRRITFIGDSVTRESYSRMVWDLGGPACSWFKKTKQDMADWWWRAQEDFQLGPGDAFSPPGKAPPPNVTLSFRFACNAFPHMTAILSDPSVRDSDVFVLNSGLWEMGTGKGIGTLDGSWMRDHMYRLSQLVLFLKQNVKARVIWRTMGAVEWSKAKEMYRFLPFKFRAMNLFAESLFRGAGYEVLDFWSAMAIDTLTLTTNDGMHGGEALLAELIFNKVCLDEPLFDEETAKEIVRAVETSSMPPPLLQGPDPPFVPFP